ncbi:MAG: hypothetical protein KAQ69_00030 [Spirochaetales bacterium]|nr:hypothetical protein [Spirochaetales bacterium]
MKVGIVVLYESSKQKILEIAKGLADGVAQNGHSAEIIDAVLESDKKLSFYNYIIFGTETISMIGGKLPRNVTSYLAQCGSISGKRSFAFVLKKGFRTGRTLSLLMKAMEFEGMFLKYSEVLKRKEDGKEIGKRLRIE